MSSWDSPIIRVSTGQLNTVDDSVIANQAGISGVSKYAGQLGKVLVVGQEQIALLTDTGVGTLYGGLYQYVRLSEDSEAVIVGQGALWDVTAAAGDFQVIDDPTQGTINGSAFAGVFINPITPGNYGFICVGGQVAVMMTHAVTDTTIGSAIVLNPETSPTAFLLFNAINDNSGASDNPNLNVGWAATAPANDTLCLAQLTNVVSRR
jgi:hypothetical protein